MMSDPSSIDSTTVDELTGKLVLVIEEKRDWREPDLMHRQLAAKVKNYVRYVRSPEFSARHNQRPQQTIVRLVTEAPPADSSLPFLERVAYELGKHGLTFEQQVGEFGTPMPVTARADSGARPRPRPPAQPPTPPPPPAEKPIEQAPPPPPAPEPEPPLAHEPPTAQEPPAAQEATPTQEPTAEWEPEWAEPQERELQETEPGWSEPEWPESETSEAEGAEVGPPDPWATPDEEAVQFGTDASIDPEPIELEPQSGASDSLPSFDEWYGDEPATPTAGEDDAAASFPDFLDASDAGGPPEDTEPSELEALIESDDASVEFVRDSTEAPVPGAELQVGDEEDLPRPPFFPEEEFGRARAEGGDVEFLDLESDTAVIETSSGQRIRLEVDADSSSGIPGHERPSLLRGIGAGLSAAVAGGIVWSLLAIAAERSAHPLAAAVGVMVGISVRLRGNGHTLPYRIVGLIFTLIGSALGAVLTAASLTGILSREGITQVVAVLSDPNAILAALEEHFGWVSLLSLALALYIAFRLSASKPEAG
ncbi:MAG: hypothetical protein GWN99_02945 [Gemmatimonadetes bacterium]|uniref:Uncharacterized protein n=1 Tax=Candidatus Kutchimonas denitrificans TaxID=3056748 RepID=A0AAE5CBS7_9BACT|nr:hypothetical protein [Gemmatimonadota bacterium]NIR74913.1 hypothetical protein [Candidatus Kutchimonas denitrificans]NIS00025.1 hypothetical protein [Gemmatimonadota bacterium]NIT65608.1 hypothetical protein [Gemmatimonadota bacterium]NIU52578.1 hypothetical protein [Gemmatimonadota bacterium]